MKLKNSKSKRKKTIFQKRIYPHENHILFEYDMKSEEIRLAIFEDEARQIAWDDAVGKNFKKINKKIILKNKCLYISALNKKNCIKILKRDYGIIYKGK